MSSLEDARKTRRSRGSDALYLSTGRMKHILIEASWIEGATQQAADQFQQALHQGAVEG